jgi:predicted transcriptional regulator of viral defense system
LINQEKNISINQWLDAILARGSYSFSKEMVIIQLPTLSDTAVKRALNRLSRKGKILSLFKGYYLIITPPFAAKGILPPTLYLDHFFKHLNRSYYLGLLNAAVYHGAGHQQPQEYFIVTEFPVLRTTAKKGLKVNYISIKKIPASLIEKKKTETGYIDISNAILTACDLIQFEKRVGGLNRVATVLYELMEVIQQEDFNKELLDHVHVAVLQRLGYMLEYVLRNQVFADALYERLINNQKTLFRTKLHREKPTRGFSSNNRWKVIINFIIEIDT